ncbi:MAG: TfoX/Sxy family protein [Alphaproteobacteria bacterium]|nr:TfoX/Sxy family protein [Alphaproteobacteria bacterium]
MMKAPDAFAQQVVGLLTPLGPARVRRMFGGFGIFMDDLMFALIIHGRLYLKVDDGTKPTFADAGSEPFTYRREGREIAMSYWLAPVGSLDHMEALSPWAELALAAARRAKGR